MVVDQELLVRFNIPQRHERHAAPVHVERVDDVAAAPPVVVHRPKTAGQDSHGGVLLPRKVEVPLERTGSLAVAHVHVLQHRASLKNRVRRDGRGRVHSEPMRRGRSHAYIGVRSVFHFSIRNFLQVQVRPTDTPNPEPPYRDTRTPVSVDDEI